MLRVVQELRPAWVVGENVAGLVSMVQSRKTVGVEGRSVNIFPDEIHYEASWVRQENMLLVELIGDLERIGYEVQAFVIPACAVGAAHRRDRIALVAWDNDRGADRRESFATVAGAQERKNTQPGGVCDDVADASGTGREKRDAADVTDRAGHFAGRDIAENVSYAKGTERLGCRTEPWERGSELGHGCGRPAQPGLGGVADGIPAWMDGYWLTEPDIPRVTSEGKDRVARLKGLGNAVYWRQFYPIFACIHHIETAGHIPGKSVRN